MTTTDYAFQANFKFGPQYKETLVNVPAQTPEEMLGKLAWLEQNAAQFVATAAALHAVPPALAGDVQPGSVQVQYDQPPAQQGPPPTPQNNGGWGAPQQQAPPSFANPATQAPACQHGPMVYREKRNQDGSYAWKAHFCPTPKGTPGQCEPKFLPKK